MIKSPRFEVDECIAIIVMSLPHFHDREYLKATKVLFTDRILHAVLLRFFPASLTPNHITLFRMIATPFILILLLSQQYTWGVPLFLFIASTDAMDGALARTRHKITYWGMMFDPLADKFLILPTALILVSFNLHWALALSLVISEMIIMIVAFFWRKQGGIIQANVWGKIKMFLQVCGVFLLLLSVWLALPLEALAALLLWMSVGFAALSMLRHGA